MSKQQKPHFGEGNQGKTKPGENDAKFYRAGAVKYLWATGMLGMGLAKKTKSSFRPEVSKDNIPVSMGLRADKHRK